MKSRCKRVARLSATVVLAAALVIMMAGSASAVVGSYEKTPGGTTAQIAKSVFYIAVNTGADGTGDRLYYYFSLDELKTKYGVEARTFDYVNHTVATKTHAHGFSIGKLVDSLVDVYGDPLPVDETWSIQYLEEDAFHATGASSIDTLAAARDTTKPLLTYEIKTEFINPTKYNVNDVVYKWAEDLYPEYLRVYRQTDSANSAVLKMMMGIAVSPDGKAYNNDTAGSYRLTGTDSRDNQIVLDSKGNPGRTVLGALAGMKISVQSPTVAAYSAAEENQIIRVEPKATSTQVVNFTYTDNDYLLAKNWVSGTSAKLTQYDIASAPDTVQIPVDLAFVQGLVATGDAASVDASSIDPTTAEFTIPIPTRKLFVDTRVDPNAYGYTDLNLYRYSGAFAADLAGLQADDVTNVVVTSTGGAKKLYKDAAARRCFVAYKDSHSKSCPNNTAESKRFTWVYNRPVLIDEFNGNVLLGSVARLDVNAPIVKSLRITTRTGSRAATIKRGRNIRLVRRSTPTVTVERFTWKSSNKRLATVSSTGLVTASRTRTGTVTITVTSTFGKKATFRLTVVR